MAQQDSDNRYAPPKADIDDAVLERPAAARRTDRGIRFLALLLVAGGAVGIAVAIFLVVQAWHQSWITVSFAVALSGMFLWTAFFGMRLWRHETRGIKWARILFALQIPVLSIAGVTYQYYTGLALNVGLRDLVPHVNSNFGASASLQWQPNSAPRIVGVNVIAIIAFVYLLRYKPSLPKREVL
jgi:hypothetical protein